MADIRTLAGVTPVRRTSDGLWTGAAATRDGALVTADWWLARSFEGRILAADMGSLATPLTFLVYAANRPDAWLRVPAGTSIVVGHVNVALEASAGTKTQIIVMQSSNDIGNGTSSAATIAPFSLRSDALFTSAVTARQLATGDTTAMTTPIEVFRTEYAVAEGTGTDNRSVLWEPRNGYPVLIGPASLIVYIAATTTQATGFVNFRWAEVPSTMFTG